MKLNMMALSAQSLRIWTAACTVFFATAAGVLAMEKQFPDDNCAITFPDTWRVMTNVQAPGIIAAYKDAAGKRCLLLEIFDIKPSGPLDDRFIAEYEQRLKKSGASERLSGKYIQVAGTKSYERLGTMVSREGKRISTMVRLVPGEDRYYNIEAMRFDGDASEDPELLQVIGSFRFLHSFVPSYAPSASYEVVIVLAVIAVIYVIKSNLRSRSPSLPPRSPPSPSRPPPLPPGAQ